MTEQQRRKFEPLDRIGVIVKKGDRVVFPWSYRGHIQLRVGHVLKVTTLEVSIRALTTERVTMKPIEVVVVPPGETSHEDCRERFVREDSSEG